MIRVPTWLARAGAAAMLASLLVLAGCHSGSSKVDHVSTEQGQFDMTLKAYKSGQFLVDGAVLSAADTGSHFSFLKDTGHLPKTVLLLPSDESKIRDNHLGFMARMQLDYGFTVYYDKKGELIRLNAVEAKARALEDTPQKSELPDRMQGKDAASGTYDPSNRNQQGF
ncbi:hypothetical protein FHW69_003634 [Luteibacter sp. Sphag1AF]|uniref:hypothetical protein n=1 Tax=Luteibacter sp. Sphag1AF TaxID=2587031 RepID=UPI00160DF485|nr:hypothetical protein [Luteibacter sp. Sphag1AF]MBB3228986.1 hypothetical protein [Luteibacter sp. Sphag1AF]